jgi:glycosyltransferase involved in cell wall biosynthesis
VIVGLDAREMGGRPTGVGRYLRSLLRYWSAEADTFLAYVAAAPPEGPLAGAVRARALPPLRPGLLWQEARMARAARADGVEVFFSPAYSCPLTLERPRVTVVHDLSFFACPEDFTAFEAWRRRLLVAGSVRRSARVVVVSDFSRRELLARFPDVEPRLAVVAHGADEDLPPPPEREQARRRLGEAGPLLLTAGSLFNRRRLPTVLRAVARLRPRWPALRLHVVGDNRTAPRRDFGALARRLGVSDVVRLAGFVPEAVLVDLYAAADVGIFVSEYEGFGLPALEAMARGLPVVVGDRPAQSEVFAGAAVAVDPQDDGALAWVVDRLLSSPEERARLARAGHALAARHSWRECAARTLEVLREARAART